MVRVLEVLFGDFATFGAEVDADGETSCRDVIRGVGGVQDLSMWSCLEADGRVCNPPFVGRLSLEEGRRASFGGEGCVDSL